MSTRAKVLAAALVVAVVILGLIIYVKSANGKKDLGVLAVSVIATATTLKPTEAAGWRRCMPPTGAILPALHGDGKD